MKRFVLYIILPLLAGCVADELTVIDNGLSNPQSKYITATVAVEGLVGTRGTPINDVSEMEDFGFFSSYTGQLTWKESDDAPNKMYNEKMVRNTDGFWTYSGTAVEWDNATAADNYTFFAYAPFATTANGMTVTSSATKVGIPTLSYTVPTTVEDQPDLMLAVPKKDIHPTGHPVSLQMKHALTAIGFMVYGEGTVTGLSITGVHDSGNLTMDGGNIAWNIPSGSVSSLDFSAAIVGGSFSVSSITPQNLLADDGYLMMIPQTLTDDAKVKVTYDGKTQELDLKDATPAWEAGRRVIYSIKIGQGEIVLGTITVTPDYVIVDYHAHTPAAQTLIVTATKGNGSPDPTATWTLTSDQPWLTFSFNNDGSGATATLNGTSTQTVYLVIEENTDTDIRIADISLNGIEHSAIVKQDYYRPLTISLSPSYIELPAMAHTPASQSIFVTALNGNDPDPTATWTLVSNDPWLTLTLNTNGSGASTSVNGTGSQPVYLVTGANGGTIERMTEVVLIGTTDFVTVLQKASTMPTISVSPSYIELSYLSQSPAPQTLSVICLKGDGSQDPYATWTLSSNQLWLWLTPNANGNGGGTSITGTGSQTIYLKPSANTGNAPRYADISLSGNVVTNVKQNNFDDIGELGSSFERIYIDDNDGNPKLLLTKNANNPAALFQFGSIKGWHNKKSGSAGSANYNPSTLSNAWNSNWLPATYAGYIVPHDVTNLRNGIGDPCRLVGYTQQEIKDAIDVNNPNAFAPDNKVWMLPEGKQLWGYQSPPRGTNTQTFPSHGRILENGNFSNDGKGYYWSGWKSGGGSPNGDYAGYLEVNGSSKIVYSAFQPNGMSIRCERQY